MLPDDCKANVYWQYVVQSFLEGHKEQRRILWALFLDQRAARHDSNYTADIQTYFENYHRLKGLVHPASSSSRVNGLVF